MPAIQTYVAGPPQWLLFHILPFSYPKKPTTKDRMKYARRILGDLETFPCNICVGNIPKNLAKVQVGNGSTFPSVKEFSQTRHFDSPDALFAFFFHFHNVVNKMLGKPVIPDNQLEQTKRKYQLVMAKSAFCDNAQEKGQRETGCTMPADGYQPCMTRIALVPRNLEQEHHGNAFYFDVSL